MFINKLWRKKPCLHLQKGAATVEFAFALVALLGFFAIYMLFVQAFMAYEQTAFVGFTASRTFSVKGTKPAILAAFDIDRTAMVEFKPGEVMVTKEVPIPYGVARVLGRKQFIITYRSPTFDEKRIYKEKKFTDDNPVPY